MIIQYHKWLEIEVLNEYFPNGICPIITLLPFSETAKQLTNYNILLQKKDNLISFYIGVREANVSSFFSEFKGLDALYFQVLVEDPLFYNYSDLPIITEDQRFFFTNFTDKNSLQKNDAVSKDDLVEVRQENLGITRPKEHDVVEIKNEAGEVLQQTRYSTKSPLTPPPFAPVNLHKLGSGKYQVWVNESMVGDTFYHFDTSLDDNALGVICIDLKPIIDASNANLRLSLQFNVRSVYWQYLIIIASNRTLDIELNEVSEVGNEVPPVDEKTYTVKGPERTVGGQTAQIFTSLSPKKLRQNLIENPELTITHEGIETTRPTNLTIKLPNPSVENLEEYITPEGTISICAKAIVYV